MKDKMRSSRVLLDQSQHSSRHNHTANQKCFTEVFRKNPFLLRFNISNKNKYFFNLLSHSYIYLFVNINDQLTTKKET